MSEVKADYVVDYPYDRPFTGRPQQIVTYPYPPMVQLPDGSWYETPDIVTLVTMVYDLRNRIVKLENEEKECVSRSMKY